MNETAEFDKIKPQWQAIQDFLEWGRRQQTAYVMAEMSGVRLKPVIIPDDLLLAEYFGIDLSVVAAESQCQSAALHQRSADFYKHILHKLRGIEGPDYGCNAYIHGLLCKRGTGKAARTVCAFPVPNLEQDIPDYTGSLTAVRTLLQSHLPGWHWNIVTNHGGGWWASVWQNTTIYHGWGAPTREIALLTAILHALSDEAYQLIPQEAAE